MTAELETEIARLSNEIRRYPGPITRCDEQLTDLLECRARLLADQAAARAAAQGCSPENIWINDGGFNAA